MRAIDKINVLLKEHGMTGAELMREIGIKSTGTYSQWNKGLSKVSNKNLKRVAEFFNVPVTSIMDDDDVPAKPDSPAKTGGGVQIADWMPSNAIPVRPGPMIPVLGQVRCGLPMYAEENICGYVSYQGNRGEKYFALQATGDSMNAAGICEGDTVIVRQQEMVDPDTIAVVCVNGDEATLKRFRQEGNLVFLSPQSYNPQHKVQVYDLKKTPIHIIGRVMEVRRSF